MVKHMKSWHAILLFVALAIIAGGQILIYNHNNKTPIPYPTPPDMPRYSLSDVLYIAQQSNPGVPTTSNPLFARFTGKYAGNGAWEILKEVGSQSTDGFSPITQYTQYAYFYESTERIFWYDSPQPAFVLPTSTLK